ncbi:hypothetical protein FGO68_gene13615 [Halteria grandinella]|uniref:Uncharacterized protein n=1 Tax=Halteria grandinella TaxID=5974 RepID=A0A8J8P0Q7_HALGN|nr:hypothetical protein FGO68_gene13615 [Halteria grandinella]
MDNEIEKILEKPAENQIRMHIEIPKAEEMIESTDVPTDHEIFDAHIKDEEALVQSPVQVVTVEKQLSQDIQNDQDMKVDDAEMEFGEEDGANENEQLRISRMLSQEIREAEMKAFEDTKFKSQTSESSEEPIQLIKDEFKDQPLSPPLQQDTKRKRGRPRKQAIVREESEQSEDQLASQIHETQRESHDLKGFTETVQDRTLCRPCFEKLRTDFYESYKGDHLFVIEKDEMREIVRKRQLKIFENKLKKEMEEYKMQQQLMKYEIEEPVLKIRETEIAEALCFSASQDRSEDFEILKMKSKEALEVALQHNSTLMRQIRQLVREHNEDRKWTRVYKRDLQDNLKSGERFLQAYYSPGLAFLSFMNKDRKIVVEQEKSSFKKPEDSEIKDVSLTIAEKQQEIEKIRNELTCNHNEMQTIEQNLSGSASGAPYISQIKCLGLPEEKKDIQFGQQIIPDTSQKQVQSKSMDEELYKCKECARMVKRTLYIFKFSLCRACQKRFQKFSIPLETGTLKNLPIQPSTLVTDKEKENLDKLFEKVEANMKQLDRISRASGQNMIDELREQAMKTNESLSKIPSIQVIPQPQLISRLAERKIQPVYSSIQVLPTLGSGLVQIGRPPKMSQIQQAISKAQQNETKPYIGFQSVKDSLKKFQSLYNQSSSSDQGDSASTQSTTPTQMPTFQPPPMPQYQIYQPGLIMQNGMMPMMGPNPFLFNPNSPHMMRQHYTFQQPMIPMMAPQMSLVSAMSHPQGSIEAPSPRYIQPRQLHMQTKLDFGLLKK